MAFCTYSWDDELASEKANCWKGAIGYESYGSEWIHDCVDVCESLEPFKLPSIAVPEWTVSTEEDFDRTKSPSQNLVQPIREIDGS